MKLRSMDDVELAINNIKNIESISFNDIALIPAGVAKTSIYERVFEDGKQLFIPMLTVVYDGCNILTLTSYDKHFDYFVKKVKDVYLKEKDRPVPGHFMETFISVDENTKKILLSDDVTKTSELYSFYKDKTGYDELLISNEKEVFGLLPLINYIIEANLSMFGKHFNSKNTINGYGPRGNYILYGEIDGTFTQFPIFIKKLKNNSYKFDIGNALGDMLPLNIQVNFNKTSLDIVCISDDLKYSLVESYEYKDGKMISIREAYIDGELKYSEPVEHEKSDVDVSLSKIDENDSLDWFRLPWNANVGFKFVDSKIDDNTTTINRKIQYISESENVFINLESAEKRLIRRTPDFRYSRDIVFDDVDKTMVGYKKDDITYIKTTFGDDGAVGEYKENYAGKSFYHVSAVDSFDQLSSNNIYPVGYDCDVYGQGDLLNNYKVKSKVMGS